MTRRRGFRTPLRQGNEMMKERRNDTGRNIWISRKYLRGRDEDMMKQFIGKGEIGKRDVIM